MPANREERTRNNQRTPWWETSIVRVGRNELLIQGYKIQDLIGNVSYADMVYLEVMGELPRKEVAKLLEAALVATCDFGVNSPAIASTRMAVTCGISFNSAIANGINVLGDIHGGASEEAMRLYYDIVRRSEAGEGSVAKLVEDICVSYKSVHKHIPGFGHPINDDCPRVRRLLELGGEAAQAGVISGKYIHVARTFASVLERVHGRLIPMNPDGAVAAIQCEIGLPAEIAKGLFCLSRGIGLLAHAYEELKAGSRLKAPCPPDVMQDEFVYVGPSERALPMREQ